MPADCRRRSGRPSRGPPTTAADVRVPHACTPPADRTRARQPGSTGCPDDRRGDAGGAGAAPGTGRRPGVPGPVRTRPDRGGRGAPRGPVVAEAIVLPLLFSEAYHATRRRADRRPGGAGRNRRLAPAGRHPRHGRGRAAGPGGFRGGGPHRAHEAILLLAVGSSNDEANAAVNDLADRWSGAGRARCGRFCHHRGAAGLRAARRAQRRPPDRRGAAVPGAGAAAGCHRRGRWRSTPRWRSRWAPRWPGSSCVATSRYWRPTSRWPRQRIVCPYNNLAAISAAGSATSGRLRHTRRRGNIRGTVSMVGLKLFAVAALLAGVVAARRCEPGDGGHRTFDSVAVRGMCQRHQRSRHGGHGHAPVLVGPYPAAAETGLDRATHVNNRGQIAGSQANYAALWDGRKVIVISGAVAGADYSYIDGLERERRRGRHFGYLRRPAARLRPTEREDDPHSAG